MFGRKKDNAADPSTSAAEQSRVDNAAATTATDNQAEGVYDPINGDFGPFDGDQVDYRNFDFSDFAKGGLDLGSMMVPVPLEGDVQVDVGPEGPQMIHIGTQFGRVTPVAFAAPKNGDLWEESVTEIVKGMSGV